MFFAFLMLLPVLLTAILLAVAPKWRFQRADASRDLADRNNS
jgi:hypothetical protein